MSIGNSGRIVIEIEPESKRQLYATLAREGLTLKDWFLKNVDTYVAARNQMPLELREPLFEGSAKPPLASGKKSLKGSSTDV